MHMNQGSLSQFKNGVYGHCEAVEGRMDLRGLGGGGGVIRS